MHAALIAVQVLFGALPVAGKVALFELSPLVVAGIRVTAAAVVFLVVQAVLGAERIRSRGDWARLVLLSVLGVSANQGLFLEGLSRTTALNAQLISTSIPALTVAAALALRRERASRLKIGGVLVAAAGVLYLIGAERFTPAAALGNALILANSTGYAFYLVLARDLLARYRAVTVATWVFVFGAVPLGSLGLASASGPPVCPAASTIAALAFIVLGPSVGTYFLNAWALRRAKASLVAVYVYGQPLVTTALVALVLREQPSLRSLPAALLVFAGVAMVAFGERERRGAATDDAR